MVLFGKLLVGCKSPLVFNLSEVRSDAHAIKHAIGKPISIRKRII